MQRFWTVALEAHSPDDLLPGAAGAAPAPAAPDKQRIICEFCECRLTIKGDAIEISDKAKTLRKQGETIESLRETIAAHLESITTITAARDAAVGQLQALQAEPTRSRSPFSR